MILRRMAASVTAVLVVVSAVGANIGSETGRFPLLRGPCLGQTPPGAEPQSFAPGVVSCGLFTRDIAWTPDGRELYLSVSAFGFNLIFETSPHDGFLPRWHKLDPRN